MTVPVRVIGGTEPGLQAGLQVFYTSVLSKQCSKQSTALGR